MHQKPLNINDIYINEINNINQDNYIYSSQNLESVNPSDGKEEEEASFLNISFFSKIGNKEQNKEKHIEKTTKTITNEEKSIPFKSKEINISIPNNNKEKIIEKIENKKLKGLDEQTFLGKKKKNECNIGKHSKFSDDNLRRKAKNLVLDYTLDFLNETIKKVYNNKIGDGISLKQLLSIDNNIKNDISIQHMKDIFNKKLGDIFSVNISKKYVYYSLDHNKNLIKRLLKYLI